ncbi:hypothetical protein AVEN_48519-1 [Araneus ventricosus]|uniref:CCHC-type domain-containing protein n=1 Tax=Araneus ventricosus TaxID=182803 RepID=A0A4Y2H2X2_ARAVE|nr:hypothetical protein AVEN_7744-1 [Araneus ventricosus]GBM59108.1 hypothetical protein AVEN_48519-1 [Araneus ventricosus]
MGKKKSGPFSGQHNTPIPQRNNFPTFFIIQRKSEAKETFHGVSPFLVEKAISGSIGEVKSTKKLRSGDLLVEVGSFKQAKEIVNLKSLSTIPVQVCQHPTLNSSKGVISCGELLNVPIEEITEKLQSQGVSHVRRITIRRDGQHLNTKHLILTFSSAKLPEHIKAGYIRLSVKVYIPNPLRCFQCQRFGHSKSSCRGTLTCARCAEVGHDSTTCTAKEKCINCKGDHTSFSRDCFAWKQEKEIISTKIKLQISYAEARKIVKSKSPTAGNSYASAVKKISATVSTQWDLADIPSGTNFKPSASTIITSSPVNVQNPSPVPVSICESASVTADLNGFQLVTNRKKLKKDSPTKTKSTSNAEKISKFYTSSRKVDASIVKQNNSNMQPVINATVISDETKLTPLVASAALSMSFPPLGEKRVLQSRESDADAEMSSSSASEEDALEYNMSEDLEDSPAVMSPPPPSKPEKSNKYKNR